MEINKIPYDERSKVYDDALILNGRELQLIVGVEELSEAAKEICKALRHDVRPQALAEEVADAMIVLEQVTRMFHLEECVSSFMDTKVKRLSQNLEKKWGGRNG